MQAWARIIRCDTADEMVLLSDKLTGSVDFLFQIVERVQESCSVYMRLEVAPKPKFARSMKHETLSTIWKGKSSLPVKSSIEVPFHQLYHILLRGRRLALTIMVGTLNMLCIIFKIHYNF